MGKMQYWICSIKMHARFALKNCIYCAPIASLDTCCLVTSFEANGDLKSFLTRQGAVYMNTTDLGATVLQQINMARQIVQGAVYLDEFTDVNYSLFYHAFEMT